MRTGKISESVLKRSVLKQIGKQNEEIIKGAGTGEDCTFLSWEQGNQITAVSTQTVALPVKEAAYLAVMAAANNLAAGGAEPKAVFLSLTLPEEFEEPGLQELMKQAKRCCEEWEMQIAGGHTEVSRQVQAPIITATAVGRPKEQLHAKGTEDTGKKTGISGSSSLSKAELDLVVSKWIGMEGTAILASEKEKELSGRYPAGLISLAKQHKEYLSVAPEAEIALHHGVCAMHDVRNGGIFGALWELSRKLGTGLCVDLKKIPVRQETIEVCEFFNMNPYQLLSGGMLLMAAKDGKALASSLEDAGIPAQVIGSTHAGNDKVVINQDETRYLEPASADEIYKIF